MDVKPMIAFCYGMMVKDYREVDSKKKQWVRSNAVKLRRNQPSSFPRKRESIVRLLAKFSMDSRFRGNDGA
jgi:hypothetical protein